MTLFFFFLALAASVSALSTPHVANHHRAIAARVHLPVPQSFSPAVQRRQNSRRCRPNPVPSPSSQQSSVTLQRVATTSASSTPRPVPTTTSRARPAPTTTPRARPAPTPTIAAPRPVGGNLPSFMVGTQTGQGTFYNTGLGACGITNNDSQFIVAVSHLLYDAYPGYNGLNPNHNPICNQQIRASWGGNSVTVTVTDRCGACALTDLDFSPVAFNTIADPALGRISGVTWEWV